MGNWLMNFIFGQALKYLEGTIKDPCSERAARIYDFVIQIEEAYERLQERREEAGCSDDSDEDSKDYGC